MHADLIEFNSGLIIILINVLVLFFILKKFFFEKVHNFIEAREDSIKAAFDSAEAINRKADEKMENYSRQIANVENEGREIVKAAKIKADAQAQDIVEQANQKASEMMVAAEKQIELERIKAMNEMKQQIATLALLAAERIVEKSIEITGQDQIVDEIIEEAGRSKWQS